MTDERDREDGRREPRPPDEPVQPEEEPTLRRDTEPTQRQADRGPELPPAPAGWAAPGQVSGPQPWPPPPGEAQPQPPGGWAPPPGGVPPGGGGWAPPPGPQAPRRSILPIILLVGAGVIALGAFAFLRQADRDETGAVTEGGSVDVLDLAVGDCLQDPLQGQSEGEVNTVQAVICDEPHDTEVYALFDLPGDDSAPYPGDDSVDIDAENGCVARFEEYVGSAYETSALFVSTISPREATWATGDREVVCLVYNPEEQLTGSVQGSGQ